MKNIASVLGRFCLLMLFLSTMIFRSLKKSRINIISWITYGTIDGIVSHFLALRRRSPCLKNICVRYTNLPYLWLLIGCKQQLTLRLKLWRLMKSNLDCPTTRAQKCFCNFSSVWFGFGFSCPIFQPGNTPIPEESHFCGFNWVVKPKPKPMKTRPTVGNHALKPFAQDLPYARRVTNNTALTSLLPIMCLHVSAEPSM